ncbi:MAG: P-loop NTPase, partial [bacterium]
SMPNQSTPNQGMPNQSMPNQSTPNQGMPNQSMPNQSTPNQGMPNQSMPNQGTPNQSMPNQGANNQDMNNIQTTQNALNQGMFNSNMPIDEADFEKETVQADEDQYKRLSVLVADHDQDVIEELYRIQNDYPSIRIIGAATDGEMAKQQAFSLRPDVVFINVDLPQIDGFELTERLKVHLNDIPVVLSVYEEDARNLSKANKTADDVLLRPFSEQEFIDSLSNAYTEVQRRKRLNKQKGEKQKNKRLGAKRTTKKESSPMENYDITDVEDLNEMVDKGLISEADKVDYLRHHKSQVIRARQNLIAVYSPKGGVGKSFIATNLAIAIAQNTKDLKIALVDFDFGYSNIDTMLGIANTTNIVDLYHNFDMEKGKFSSSNILEETSIKHPSGLHIFLGPGRLEHGELFTDFHASAILNELKEQNYDIIIVDTTTELRDTTLATLEAAKNIILVAEQNVCTIRDVQKVMEMFRNLDIPQKKVNLVLNKTTHDNAIAIKEIPSVLTIPLKATIPYDKKLVTSSINQGKPLVLGEPNDVMRAILSISAQSNICPELQKELKLPEDKKSIVGSLFSSSKSKRKTTPKERKREPKRKKPNSQKKRNKKRRR